MKRGSSSLPICAQSRRAHIRGAASLVISSFSCVFDLTGRVISFLDLDAANRALALRRGLGDSGVVSWLLPRCLIDATTRCVCRRSAHALLWTRSTHHDNERHYEMLSSRRALSRVGKYLRRAADQEVADSERVPHEFWTPTSRILAAVRVLRGFLARWTWCRSRSPLRSLEGCPVTPGPTQQRAPHP